MNVESFLFVLGAPSVLYVGFGIAKSAAGARMHEDGDTPSGSILNSSPYQVGACEGGVEGRWDGPLCSHAVMTVCTMMRACCRLKSEHGTCSSPSAPLWTRALWENSMRHSRYNQTLRPFPCLLITANCAVVSAGGG